MPEILLDEKDVNTESPLGQQVKEATSPQSGSPAADQNGAGKSGTGTNGAGGGGAATGADAAAQEKAKADAEAAAKLKTEQEAAAKTEADKKAKETQALQAAEADKLLNEAQSKLLKELFGEDEGAPKTKEEALALVQSIPKLVDTIKKLESSKVEFHNDYVKGLNEYLKQGGTKEVYERVQALDLKNLKGLDAVKALYNWQYPDLTTDQVDLIMKDKYKLGDGHTPEQQELGKAYLVQDAKKAIDELSKIKAEQSVPEPERLRQAEEKEEADRLEAWKPTSKKILDDFNDFDIPLAVGDDGKVTDTFKFTEVTPAMRKQLLEDVRNIIEVGGIPHTQDGVRMIMTVARERFLIRNFTTIATAMATEMKTRADKEARKLYANSGQPPGGDIPDDKSGDENKTNADELYEKHMKRHGG